MSPNHIFCHIIYILHDFYNVIGNNFRIFLYLKFENQLEGLYGKIEVCITSPFCFLFERVASSCLSRCSTSLGFLYWAFYMKEQYSTMCFSGVDEKNETKKKKIYIYIYIFI